MAAETQLNSEGGSSTALTQQDLSDTHEESTFNHVSIE
jgi:hypothetical protein